MAVRARFAVPLTLLGLVLVAVAGYLAGSHRSPVAATPDPPSAARVLSNSGVLLEYPLDWQRSASSVSIPGLVLTNPVTLFPPGVRTAGLLSGHLASSGSAPLPAAFIARLRKVPHTEIVDLVSTQAYRYSQLEVQGYTGSLDLYVIPVAGGGEGVVGCFGPQPLTPAGQQCERIVSTLALTGPSTSTLAAEPTYATKLATLVDSIDAERARARKEMSSSGSAATIAEDAASLASHLSSAAASLETFEPPALVAAAGAALASALRGAAQSYSALSEAARAESVSSYDAARTRVVSAEGGVDRALETFSLLGYGP